MFIVVALLTLIISSFAFSQIIGTILFKIPKGQYIFIISIGVWGAILFGYYLLASNLFANYISTYYWCTGIAFILSLLTIKSNFNQKTNENQTKNNRI